MNNKDTPNNNKNRAEKHRKRRGRPKSEERTKDENLIIAYRNGDENAFNEIINTYSNQIYNFVIRLVGSPDAAEDILQDTFVRVLKNIDTYQPTAKLLTWLIQIAKNLCFDYFKKESLRTHLSLSNDSEKGEYSLENIIEDDTQKSPDQIMMLDEDTKLVRQAIEKLSAKKREVIILRIYQGLPYRDIAEITGEPEGTLKYRVYESIREISAYLNKKHTPRTQDDT